MSAHAAGNAWSLTRPGSIDNANDDELRSALGEGGIEIAFVLAP